VLRRIALLALGAFAAGCTCTDPPRSGLPVFEAPKADRAPTIDGRLDEAIWDRAGRTDRFVDTMTGAIDDPETFGRIAWDDTNLYVAFEVKDDYLRCTLSGDDPHLWEQDTVEVMADPGGDGRNYFELQLSPTEQIFDTRYDSRRIPQPFGHVDWDSGMRGATVVDGTVNDEEDDEGYVAEMAIPWSAFAAGSPPASPPRAGEEWRIALYLLDSVRNGWRAVGWSPPLVGDFHVPDRFGTVRFVD
jgi:hypothetical protein